MKVGMVFKVLLLISPISYVISSLSGVKLNYLSLFLLFVCSSFLVYKSSRLDFIFLALATFLAILMFLVGSFGFESYFSFIIGYSVLNASVFESRRQAALLFHGIAFRRSFVVISLVFSLVVVFQFLGVLPVTVWNLEFQNAASTSFLGEGFRFIRPNGFFYHPYELCLFLTGLLFYLFRIRRLSLMVFIYVPLNFMLFLKSWLLATLLFLAAYILRRLRNFWFRVMLYSSIIVVCVFFVLDLYLQFGDTLLSGRVNLWYVYFSVYREDYGLLDYIIGPNFHPLVKSNLWLNDYVPGAHNQFVSFFVFWGILGVSFCIILLFRLFYKYGRELKDELFFLMVIVFTMGMSGEPLSVPLMWIALASGSLSAKSRLKNIA